MNKFIAWFITFNFIKALACAALLRCLGVVPLEVLLRVALDAVALPLREHQMHVRLFLAVRRRGRVDRPLIGVAVAYLLAYKLAHQRGPLVSVKLTRKGNLYFAVSGAVLALEGVRRLPERLRVGLRLGGHVARLGCLQLFASLQAVGVLAFAGDIGSMRPGLPGLAYLHAQSPDCHRSPAPVFSR